MEINAALSQVQLSIVRSDLFENIPEQEFDWIVINPPYYPQDPRNEEEKAWFCGKDFEFFQELFKDLGQFMNQSSSAIMILCQDCDQEAIREIAGQHGFQMRVVLERRRWLEMNYIYRILPLSSS